LHRVAKLADRTTGERPSRAAGYQNIVPLKERLGQGLGVGSQSKAVDRLYHRLLAEFGSELFILRELPMERLEAGENSWVALGISRMRRGEVEVQAGYDGEYGVIRVLNAGDLAHAQAPSLF
jgi:PHP family Zn ribbon phosphoesterase